MRLTGRGTTRHGERVVGRTRLASRAGANGLKRLPRRSQRFQTPPSAKAQRITLQPRRCRPRAASLDAVGYVVEPISGGPGVLADGTVDAIQSARMPGHHTAGHTFSPACTSSTCTATGLEGEGSDVFMVR